jgi:hypothetical protein
MSIEDPPAPSWGPLSAALVCKVWAIVSQFYSAFYFHTVQPCRTPRGRQSLLAVDPPTEVPLPFPLPIRSERLADAAEVPSQSLSNICRIVSQEWNLWLRHRGQKANHPESMGSKGASDGRGPAGFGAGWQRHYRHYDPGDRGTGP